MSTVGAILSSLNPSAGQSIRVNAGDNGWEAYTPSGGGGSSNPRTLVASTTLTTLTGTTSETVMATYTMPANTMPSTGLLRITVYYSRSGTAGNITYRIRFGGLTGNIYSSNLINTTATNNLQGLAIIYADNSTSAQKALGSITAISPFQNTATTKVTSSINTTSNVDVVITGQLAASADTAQIEAYSIELIS